MPPFSHVPVLADAVLDAARQIPRPDGLLIDATLGGGGHSALLLEQHPGLRLIGLDQDATARAASSTASASTGTWLKGGTSHRRRLLKIYSSIGPPLP